MDKRLNQRITIFSIKHVLLATVVSVSLIGCFDLNKEKKEAEEDCAAGDQAACAKLDALNALLGVIPDDLTVASSTEGGGEADQLFDEKQGRINSVLTEEVIATGDVSRCFEAMPRKPQFNSPQCYGPGVRFENHPDYDPGLSGPGQSADGNLPTGDLGLWVESEPGSGTACAAAKLNELIGKAAYNVDLGMGAMAMMVCAAAMGEEALPGTDGGSIDVTTSLQAGNDTRLSITSATIAREDLTDGTTAFKTTLEAVGNDESFKLVLHHAPESQQGLMQMERGRGQQEMRGTSVAYDLSSDTHKFKLVSAQFRDGDVDYASDGQITLVTVDDMDPNASGVGNNGDVHVMVANVNRENGQGAIAYGWNAGGRDDHYRVINVETSNGAGNAYYGYAPSPTSGAPETLSMDLSAATAGMICNWAGPGNQHQPQAKLQHQVLSQESDGKWVATSSSIKYAPTNSCDAPAAVIFVPVQGGPGSSQDNQALIDAGGEIDGVQAFSNDLFDKNTGTVNFTLPTEPDVVE